MRQDAGVGLRAVDLRGRPPPRGWGVEVDEAALRSLADAWRDRPFPLPDYDMPGIDAPRDAAHWFDYAGLTIAVAACLWPPDGDAEWHVEYQGRLLTDMPALFACFSRGLPRTAHGYHLERVLTWHHDDWERFFAGAGVLQLRSLRRQRLLLLVETLIADWDGSFRHVAEAARFHAADVVSCLTETLPGFLDVSPTDVGLLPFNKLAHLATSLMARCEDVQVTGVDQLPAFPDYMLPRVLRAAGVLRYTERLAAEVDALAPIEHGGRWECALRWATVHAVDRLRDELASRGNPTCAVAVDYALWRAAALEPGRGALGPHHRCLTMAY